MSRYNSIIVLGPTASGKTKLAVQVARVLQGEILSIDSRQVYQKLDIGTGKDYADYGEIPYHLIDLVPPGQRFNVYDFLNAFNTAWDDVIQRQRLPVLCGGTGLYYDVLLKKNELVAVPVNEKLRLSLQNKTKPELEQILKAFSQHNRYPFDFSTTKRLTRAIEVMHYLEHNAVPTSSFKDIRPLIIGIKTDVETRRQNISLRLKQRLGNGLVEEAENLLAMGISHEQLRYFGLEYKFLSMYLSGEIDREQLFARLETAIHQYARRQMTWFRKMEREGFDIHWLTNGEVDKAVELYGKK